jgi:hypothetical protein
VCSVAGVSFASSPAANFTDNSGPLAAANYTATINWGDGTPATSGTITFANGIFAVQGSHTYAQEGSYSVVVSVSAVDGPMATTTVTATVFGFVTSLYQTVLERAPDPAGLAFWLQQLSTGVSHGQIAQAFWVSPEHRGLEVDQFYATLLHRPADAAGRAFWVNDLLAGASETDVAVDFLVSAEYMASHPDVASYVTGLYADVLGRSPDSPGLAFWEQIIQSGTRSRAAVAYYFLTSTEAYLVAIDDYYRVFLGRKPGLSEEQNFLAALVTGATPAEITSIFLASGEFITREIAISCQNM